MSSLFGSLSTALRSLLAQRGASETTPPNIVKANALGYTGQRRGPKEGSPILDGSIPFGSGVGLASSESIRDRILELRTQQETQQQGRLEAFLGAMQQVEALFKESEGVGLQGVLDRFFRSLQALSASPTSLPLRQAVLTAGGELAAALRNASSNLSVLRSSHDNSVSQSVAEVNQLTGQTADLNGQISGLQGAGQLAMAFVDRRDLLIGRLSNLIDLSAIGAEDGSLTLTTSHGTALVVGEESFPLETQVDPGCGLQHIMSQGSDITATLTAGKLAGLLEVRDKVLPGFLSDLDELAARLVDTVNSVHRAGFDLSGAPGEDFFVPFIPAGGSNTGAAASFAMSLTDPAKVAASADGASASNGNVLSLAAMRDQNIVNGQPPVAFWANLVSRLGNDILISAAELEAEGLILEQLQNQRSAVSGVSLDEEAASLIRYQRAFEAAAHVGATLNELTDAAVNSGRY